MSCLISFSSPAAQSHTDTKDTKEELSECTMTGTRERGLALTSVQVSSHLQGRNTMLYLTRANTVSHKSAYTRHISFNSTHRH